MQPFRAVVHQLAMTFLAGRFDEPGLLSRGRALLPRPKAWLPKLVQRLIARFGEGQRPRRLKLIEFLKADRLLRLAWEKPSFDLESRISQPEFVSPNDHRADWPVPRWSTISELGDWRHLAPNELAWFADRKGLERFAAEGPLRHYRYRWFRKRGGEARLIESPKSRLKQIQRRLLSELFEANRPTQSAHRSCLRY